MLNVLFGYRSGRCGSVREPWIVGTRAFQLTHYPHVGPAYEPAHEDQRGAESEEAQIPSERGADVIPDVVRLQEVMVHDALDDVESTPSDKQRAP